MQKGAPQASGLPHERANYKVDHRLRPLCPSKQDKNIAAFRRVPQSVINHGLGKLMRELQAHVQRKVGASLDPEALRRPWASVRPLLYEIAR